MKIQDTRPAWWFSSWRKGRGHTVNLRPMFREKNPWIVGLLIVSLVSVGMFLDRALTRAEVLDFFRGYVLDHGIQASTHSYRGVVG